MAGIGVEELVIAAAGHDFEAVHRWLAASGVAGAYIAMAMILVSSTSRDGSMHFHRKALLRLGAAALVIVLAAAGGSLGPAAFGVILAVIAAAQVAADVGETWLSNREAPAPQPASDGAHGH
jgi:cytochrome bd-type quinol oxidase subunit 2